MANFLTAQKKANLIIPSKVRKDLYTYIRSIENEFFKRNIEQLEDHVNAKGGLLENRDSRFNGVYSQLTKDISILENPLAPKREGEPYNFLWTGEFFKGFELFITNGTLFLFSTGTGSGEKADFFNGYQDLFGLTDNHLNEVIDSFLLPFLITYYRSKLL